MQMKNQLPFSKRGKREKAKHQSFTMYMMVILVHSFPLPKGHQQIHFFFQDLSRRMFKGGLEYFGSPKILGWNGKKGFIVVNFELVLLSG